MACPGWVKLIAAAPCCCSASTFCGEGKPSVSTIRPETSPTPAGSGASNVSVNGAPGTVGTYTTLPRTGVPSVETENDGVFARRVRRCGESTSSEARSGTLRYKSGSCTVCGTPHAARRPPISCAAVHSSSLPDSRTRVEKRWITARGSSSETASRNVPSLGSMYVTSSSSSAPRRLCRIPEHAGFGQRRRQPVITLFGNVQDERCLGMTQPGDVGQIRHEKVQQVLHRGQHHLDDVVERPGGDANVPYGFQPLHVGAGLSHLLPGDVEADDGDDIHADFERTGHPHDTEVPFGHQPCHAPAHRALRDVEPFGDRAVRQPAVFLQQADDLDVQRIQRTGPSHQFGSSFAPSPSAARGVLPGYR